MCPQSPGPYLNALSVPTPLPNAASLDSFSNEENSTQNVIVIIDLALLQASGNNIHPVADIWISRLQRENGQILVGFHHE